ncbi:hypothetical protein BG000_011463 [Podila horticola]|nr:hypothetical protein BG000_011463 [Podila horticola]
MGKARKMTAVLLFGNAGAGKSNLLTQLGGTKFKSGATFRRGCTKKVEQEQVTLSNGQKVMLVDEPGLFEPSEAATQNNATELNAALKLDYEFKIFLVMKAENRGPWDAELVMMSKINEFVKTAHAKDNFKSFFDSLDIKGFLFDIKIDGVMLLRYSSEDISCGGFKEKMEEEVHQHSQTTIHLEERLAFSNSDVRLFELSFKAFAAKMFTVGGPLVGVVDVLGWWLYHGSKATREHLKKAFAPEG